MSSTFWEVKIDSRQMTDIFSEYAGRRRLVQVNTDNLFDCFFNFDMFCFIINSIFLVNIIIIIIYYFQHFKGPPRTIILVIKKSNINVDESSLPTC